MKRLLCLLPVAMLAMLVAPASAEEFGTRQSNLPTSIEHVVRIDSSLSVNDFSAPIAACPTMVITFDQATQAQVRVYATNKDDDTVAEIEAAAVLADLDATSTSQTEVNPGTAEVRVVVDQVETIGSSEVRILCSNLAGVGGGGGAGVTVSSFAELEAAMRAADLETDGTATESVNLYVTLGEDFTYDETSTVPFEINLPVGGGEHPRITIDLGGNYIVSQASPVIQVDFGNPNGPCTVSTVTGFVEDEADCMGVAHDFQFDMKNGMVTTDADSSSCTTGSVCDRYGVELVNLDRLLFVGAGSRYSGRIGFHDLKIGGAVNGEPAGLHSSFGYNGDSCLVVEGFIAEIQLNETNFECWDGLAVEPMDTSGNLPAVSDWAPRIMVNNYQFFLLPFNVGGTFCISCIGGGAFDIEEAMPNGQIIGNVSFPAAGQLGRFAGGNFDLRVTGNNGGNGGECYDGAYHTAATTFLDNASNTAADNTTPVSGYIQFAGMMCVQSWVQTEAVGHLRMVSYIRTNSTANRYPAFYYDDTVDTSREAVVVGVSPTAEFTGGLELEFYFADAITVDPATEFDGSCGSAWCNIMDTDITAGTVFDNAYEYVTVKMGARGTRTDNSTGTPVLVTGPNYGI